MIKLLAAAAMLGGQAASPPLAPACLTRQQVGDASVVVSSIAMEVIRESCRPHLAANAFLLQPAGADHLERLRAEADRRFHSVASLMAPLFGGESHGHEIRRLFQALVTTDEAEGGVGPLDAPFCREIDQTTEAMSSMSPQHYAQFFAAFYSMIQQAEARAAAARATAAASAEAPGEEPALPPLGMPSLPPICPE